MCVCWSIVVSLPPHFLIKPSVLIHSDVTLITLLNPNELLNAPLLDTIVDGCLTMGMKTSERGLIQFHYTSPLDGWPCIFKPYPNRSKC